jgi:hypothetical protein
VYTLNVITEAERTDEMRVETRAQAPGTRRGREEIDARYVDVGLFEAGSDGLSGKSLPASKRAAS